ncbi:uncharacterized protein LOC128546963 [Mercenaria mercenaria]|uniref:uncharacterized protein LOC128546963 n=1 Tax=Mercenaria mercenaria TaxID=6596 RepID=UPI00234E71C1|nr:uncharacterized protein LOC128546963 [Mercenaria mercenaria]
MFDRDYLPQLVEAIEESVRLEDTHGKRKEKYGQKLTIDAIILKSIKTLHGFYPETKQDEKRKEMKNFKLTYKNKSCELYPQARQTCVKNSLEKARRPDKLLTTNAVRQVKEYITVEMNHVVSEYTLKHYAWLRSLVVARLTLYNARRREAAARLLMREWEMAQTGAWLPPDQIERVNDPAEKFFLGQYKLVIWDQRRQYVPLCNKRKRFTLFWLACS